MTLRDRDYVRKLQDKILEHADRHGMPDSLLLTERYNESPTLADLRTHIYPSWVLIMEEVLSELKSD